MVEKKSTDNDYLTYGLIAGGVVLAGAAFWYLSGSDASEALGFNKMDYENVHTVERLREFLDEYALDTSETIVISYNLMLKYKEKEIWKDEYMKVKKVRCDMVMDMKLANLFKKYADDVVEDSKVIKKGLGVIDENGF